MEFFDTEKDELSIKFDDTFIGKASVRVVETDKGKAYVQRKKNPAFYCLF